MTNHMSSVADVILDKTVGVLLGGMCGDILGAPVEGQHMTAHELKEKWGEDGIRNFESGYHLGLDGLQPAGKYTDDTNSVLALANSLVQMRGLDPRDAAESYARFWAVADEPERRRGYPESAQIVMAAVAAGADITTIGRVLFPTGSFANGGAMRISPVGVAFRNATDEELGVAVENAVVSSHRHPEAIDGAVVMAKAIAFLMKHTGGNGGDVEGCGSDDAGSSSSTDPFHLGHVLLKALSDVATTPAMTRKINCLRRHYGKEATWGSIVWTLAEDDETETAGRDKTPVQKRRWFQIRATTAVSCALWAFLGNIFEPENAVVAAVGLGGDADTIGSICGAMCGALHGKAWIPARWFDRIENDGAYGRDYVVGMAAELAELDLRVPLKCVVGGERWMSNDGRVSVSPETCRDESKAAKESAVFQSIVKACYPAEGTVGKSLQEFAADAFGQPLAETSYCL